MVNSELCIGILAPCCVLQISSVEMQSHQNQLMAVLRQGADTLKLLQSEVRVRGRRERGSNWGAHQQVPIRCYDSPS